MNIVVFLSFLVLAAPIVPAFVEIFRRKDKGPRKIPEQTLYEEETETSRTLPIFERSRARARVKIAGEILRIVGDVSIPNGVEIRENIVVHGNLRLGSKCHIHGSIKTLGEVEVGEDSVVEGHIISEGKVTLGPNARVKGIVDSTGDIILKENTVVEAVSTEKSVRLASGAKVNRRIQAGVSITAPSPPPATKEEEKTEAERALKVAVPSFNTLFEDRTYEETPEEATLKRLSQREVEIYKLVVSGHSIDEIGLRLLIDRVQVRELIDSLIKRAYLDEQLKPVRPEGVQKVPEEATAAIQWERKDQERPEVEELSVEEVFERLLESKLRTEVKEQLKGEQKEESVAEAEMKENLREWQEASSLISGKEREENKDNHKTTGILEQSEIDREALDSAGRCRGTEGENASKTVPGRYWKGFLPISTLLSALFTEASYYSPSLFLFLKGLVPPTFNVWMLFLGVTMTLAVTTGVYSVRSIFSSPKLRVE